MELMDAIRQRRAVRDFTSEAVAEGSLRRAIEAACWAPSATNEQPWLFTIVSNMDRLNSISEQAKTYMRLRAGKSMPLRLASQLSDPNFQIFHHAPALVVISTDSPTVWAIEDCALAAENFMLAAHAEGLGTCWIGLAQEWLGTPEGRQSLNLASGCLPVAPIIVGHAKTKPVTVPRRQPQIHWLT